MRAIIKAAMAISELANDLRNIATDDGKAIGDYTDAEVLAGAAPTQWSVRAKQADSLIAEIRAHDCRKSGCGPVCTAFDW